MPAKENQAYTQKLIDFLSVASDAEQVRRHPLPTHAIAKEEEHLRLHYALVLAALLTTQDQVSEAQSRLLMLLLDSIGLGDIRADLFDKARNLEPATLLEAARLLSEANWQEELLIDTLILLRIDAPLSADVVKLISALTDFLDLDAEQVEIRANHAAQILGIGNNSNEILMQHWPQRIPYELTTDKLQQGITRGLWFVNKKIEANFPWQASNALFFFAQDASIHTKNHTDTTKLNNCQFNLARLVFTGEGEVKMNDCSWHGLYPEATEAFYSSGISTSVHSCEFTTKNATALAVTGAELSVSNSRFITCGSERRDSGAIYHDNGYGVGQAIVNCHFNACIGRQAGAIWSYYLREVSSCEFIDCHSTDTKQITNLAIQTPGGAEGDPVVRNSVFRNSSLSIGPAHSGMCVTFIRSCQFDNSNVYYYSKWTNTIHSDCVFNHSTTIEKDLN